MDFGEFEVRIIVLCRLLNRLDIGWYTSEIDIWLSGFAKYVVSHVPLT